MIERNKPIYQFINVLTYHWLLLTRKKRATDSTEKAKPIWVMGMFRSGTSLTTQILEALGVDLGSKEHLLQAKGTRKELNSNGFYENYLFMDWSLKVFRDLNSWGDNLPSKEAVEEYQNEIDFKNFARHSIVDIHDDRISNAAKVKVLRNYSPENFDQYFQESFEMPFAVKNPHFSVLYPLLQRQWSESTFLVVFRNPDDTIASAKKVTPNADHDLYFQYYVRLLLETNVNAIYFSYDALIANPETSVEALVKALDLDVQHAKKATELVNPKQSKKANSPKGEWSQQINDIYEELSERAINT